MASTPAGTGSPGRQARPTAGRLLVAGTTSDAGKTLVTTALCRALARRGLRVAPFKAQNMSNNSVVTASGAQIARAQWVQAIAAGAEPEAAMSPVLLEPGSDTGSHVVVMGQPRGRLAAGEFASGRQALARAAFDAFDDLASRFDVVVCEGAGSAAEINLRRNDFVNMGLARHARMPTVVVGDIDRGGVLAAMFGTLALLDPDDQALLVGFIVNKFRGDVTLLRPGLDQLTVLTGRPVIGVLPWEPGLWLDSEDTLTPEGSGPSVRAGAHPDAVLRVAVVRLPRIANFTDVDALTLEPNIDLTLVDEPRSLASADLVVLPGTRATLADLAWLRRRGLADALASHASGGGAVLGLGGGYQMLGRDIDDAEGIEGPGQVTEGLGLLDVRTHFTADKVVRLSSGCHAGLPVSGYETHHGRVTVGAGDDFPGGARSGLVHGTMWHGTLESDVWRRAWLAEVAAGVGRDRFEAGDLRFADARERRLDRLGDLAEEHLDLEHVLELVTSGAPSGLPTLSGGLA